MDDTLIRARCKVCGEPIKTVIKIPFGLGKDGITETIVDCECACGRKEREEQEKRRKWEEEHGRIKKLRKLSLIDERLKDVSMATFITSSRNLDISGLIMRYVSKFDKMYSAGQGLLFYGDVGTGKTYAAAVIANELLKKMVPVVMTSFIKLINESMKFEESNDVLSRLGSARLLIVDDLGAERGTDYALEKVYDIIDSRYRSKKPVILTTNMSLGEMMNAEDIRYKRIYDRIFEMCYPVQMTGGSWRKSNAAKRFDDMKKILEE